MTLRRIQVIGSSAASNFSNNPEDKSWPALLRNYYEGALEFEVSIRGGLTPVRAIDEILNIQPCDILILHLGTSVGWPVPLASLNQRLGIDFEAEHALHQPAFRSPFFWRRVKGFLKLKSRNAIKYLLFFTGMYRPRINIAELKEQVDAVLNLGYIKAPRIIWIQHRALQHRRIFLERAIYSRFYSRIIETLNLRLGPSLAIITEDQEFLDKKNYLLDYVHLSDGGHREIFDKILEAIDYFENEA